MLKIFKLIILEKSMKHAFPKAQIIIILFCTTMETKT